jgi:mannan endo-1,4-beta-mannosidase
MRLAAHRARQKAHHSSMGLMPALFAALALGAPFVQQSGTQLTLSGAPFRFGGANIEWLGLSGYGPSDPQGPRYPSTHEVDDALDTALELGATVVRSQTLADSVGCTLCLEPEPGMFNEAAFRHVDYALAAARARGIRLIPTLVGDDARDGGGGCVYLAWNQVDVPGCSLSSMAPFYTDEGVIAGVEQHIAAVLNHVNVYTHIAYKDDPTILGWDLLNGGNTPPDWTQTIANYVRSLDSRHLILSGASNAQLPNVDVCVSFLYPHWALGPSVVAPQIDACRRAHKPFVVYEYGWDRTNFATPASFRTFLASLERDPEVAGDAFWALEAHADSHGWRPIPADVLDPGTAASVESGEWWALYYPGRRTLVNTAADMAARAQAIRRHDYAMAGRPLPPHALPPAPEITSFDRGRLFWRGSAGAVSYTIERARTRRGPWRTVCSRCATDDSNGYPAENGWYRVVPYNADARPGAASPPRRVP